MSSPLVNTKLKPNVNRKRKSRSRKPKVKTIVEIEEKTVRPLNKPKRQGKGLPGMRGKITGILKGRKLTADGRNFLYKYINPCHNDGRHCSGVPLAIPEETAIVSSRVDQTVSAPPALVTLWNNNSTSNDWYLGVFVPPWLDDCVFLIASAVQVTQFSALSKLISGSLEYPSWTSTITNPTLATGIWYCKISSPMVLPRDTVLTNRHQDFSNFRLIGRGVTTQLISDALTNRGEVTASQWNAPPSPININTTAVISGSKAITNTTAGYQILFGEVTPKFITAADNQTYQGMAVDGCYMPIYMNE